MKHPPLDLSLRLVSQLFCESAVDMSGAATVALVVLERRRVYMSLIIKLEAGAIRKVTTFDSLHLERIPVYFKAQTC